LFKEINAVQLKGFYFITDHQLSQNGSFKDVQLAIKAGVTIVQFREKVRKKQDYISELREIKSLCQENNAALIINDNLELTIEIEADGIHIGQGDMPLDVTQKALGKDKIIGVSTGTIEEALDAEKDRCSYIGVGSIFPTKTKKKNQSPLGVIKLKEFKQKLTLPIVAIGGINFSNGESVINTGVDMICAISQSLKDGKVTENIENFNEIFRRFL